MLSEFLFGFKRVTLSVEFNLSSESCLGLSCCPLEVKSSVVLFQARQDVTHVVANLQRQRVQYRIIACEYLEQNLHIMDIFIPG